MARETRRRTRLLQKTAKRIPKHGLQPGQRWPLRMPKTAFRESRWREDGKHLMQSITQTRQNIDYQTIKAA